MSFSRGKDNYAKLINRINKHPEKPWYNLENNPRLKDYWIKITPNIARFPNEVCDYELENDSLTKGLRQTRQSRVKKDTLQNYYWPLFRFLKFVEFSQQLRPPVIQNCPYRLRPVIV